MKKTFYSLFLLLIVCRSSDNLDNSIDEDFEIHFTNADVLNVRREPYLNSEIINQIPFGSKINTSNKKNQESSADKIHLWHYVKEANGFVTDHFLQKSETYLVTKKMVLKSSYSYLRCNPYGIGIYKTMELQNNKVYFTDEFIDFDLGKRQIFNGNYQIEKDSILINLEKLEELSISYTEGTSKIVEKHKTKEKNTNSILLFWKDSIKGYITDNQTKYLDSTIYNVDIKSCIFTHKKCKHYDPLKEDCSKNRANSDICDQIGYFCKR